MPKTDPATTLINLRAFLEILGLGEMAEKLTSNLNLDDILAAFNAQAAKEDAELKAALDKLGVDKVFSPDHSPNEKPHGEDDHPDVGTAADIRIIEQVPGFNGNVSGPNGILKPNALYVNGQKMLVPRDSELTIHGTHPNMEEAIAVTFTVFARSIQIGAERKPDGPAGS